MSNITKNDPTGTTVKTVKDGKICGPYRRCPHCGLVDYHRSVQGVKQSHFEIWRVGATLQYECGRCRKQFYCLETVVPANMSPLELHDKITSFFLEELT